MPFFTESQPIHHRISPNFTEYQQKITGKRREMPIKRPKSRQNACTIACLAVTYDAVFATAFSERVEPTNSIEDPGSIYENASTSAKIEPK